MKSTASARRLAIILLLAVPAGSAWAAPEDPSLPQAGPRELQQLEDDRLRQLMIQDSIASFHGRCACPYQVDRHNHSCRNHVPSRGARPVPLCYAADVTDAMVAAWRRHHQ